jgi:hypothetical protein
MSVKLNGDIVSSQHHSSGSSEDEEVDVYEDDEELAPEQEVAFEAPPAVASFPSFNQ